MGNLDFSNQPGFSWYCVFLLISGVALIVMALLPRLSGGNNAVSLLVGVLMGGYGFYLTFLWNGGTYYMFYYVFIVPILLIVNTFKAANMRKAAKSASAQQQAYAAQQQAVRYAARQQNQAQAAAQAQVQPPAQQLPTIPAQATDSTPPAQAAPSADTAAL